MAITATEYAKQLRELLPVGAAWDETRKEMIMERVLLAVADELSRVSGRSDDLIRELDPAKTLELLVDWENALGLPDPCVTAAQTVPERRDAVVTKYTNIGGQSRQFFIELAASLGYTITIEEFNTFCSGSGASGDPICDPDWEYAWRVRGEEITIRNFLCGQNTSGDRLRTWGNEPLECAITARKPAHTIVLFAYGEA